MPADPVALPRLGVAVCGAAAGSPTPWAAERTRPPLDPRRPARRASAPTRPRGAGRRPTSRLRRAARLGQSSGPQRRLPAARSAASTQALGPDATLAEYRTTARASSPGARVTTATATRQLTLDGDLRRCCARCAPAARGARAATPASSRRPPPGPRRAHLADRRAASAGSRTTSAPTCSARYERPSSTIPARQAPAGALLRRLEDVVGRSGFDRPPGCRPPPRLARTQAIAATSRSSSSARAGAEPRVDDEPLPRRPPQPLGRPRGGSSRALPGAPTAARWCRAARQRCPAESADLDAEPPRRRGHRCRPTAAGWSTRMAVASVPGARAERCTATGRRGGRSSLDDGRASATAPPAAHRATGRRPRVGRCQKSAPPTAERVEPTRPPAPRRAGRHGGSGATRAAARAEDASRQTAALRALSTPTPRPGRPAASARSRAGRPARPRPTCDEVSGTPITGRSVWAAATPGSAADSPAPAMITCSPRIRAFLR